ncbi:alcohol dehydrogenase catalytic domain-containing protein [Streptomyces sp. NPDC035033]|uniref:alcohol dehydrogenase catalytic domain-containing protein n=1 Tax=Streptomyces sp. NPDC035033 TaxID=3155368 RepID=UPI0033CCBB37
MKAVVWRGIGDIGVEDVPEPTVEDPYDAIVRITTSAICGTDLHFVRGTMPGMREGRVLGHEAVGVVEEVGPGVRNLRPGDRVVVPSTYVPDCSAVTAGAPAGAATARSPRGRPAPRRPGWRRRQPARRPLEERERRGATGGRGRTCSRPCGW